MEQSNFSERSLEDSSDQNLQENSTNCSSLNRHDETFISSKFPKFSFKNNSRFVWEPRFSKNAIVNILETNFQSMKVQIYFGNYKLITNVILTKIKQQDLFYGNPIGAGVFGKVYLLNYQNFQYAIKVVKIKSGILEWGTLQFYKEYFLYCMADELNVGPEIYSLFGYDVIFLKNAAFFVMQKCLRNKSFQSGQIQYDLLKALDIMHAHNIVHLDLKPQNISYSQKRQRHVFLDFGLSKIIKEEIGQKTLTRFLGTLSYCSEEMKKCYILQHELLIDLYENDKFCLNKTFDQIILLHENKESERGKQIVNSQNINLLDESKQKKAILQSVVLVLNLKFHLFKVNVPQVLSSIRKCSSLPRTCYEIFQYKNIKSDYLQVPQIEEILKGFQNQVFLNQAKLSDTDNQVSGFFNQNCIKQILQESIPIAQILKASQAQFKRLMDSPEWVVKIFQILDPLEEWQNFKYSGAGCLMNQIIEKIYQLCQEKDKNVRFPNFICFKSEYAIHFFYDKLKDLQNVKFLISLRIMFLVTMSKLDKKLIKQIESDILDLTLKESEKILRIIQFYFHWSLLNNFFPFQHRSLFQNIEKIKAKNNEERSNHEQNVYQLLIMFTSKQTFYNMQLSQFRQFADIQLKISQILSTTPQPSEIQLLLDIKNLFSFISGQYVFDIGHKKHFSMTFLAYLSMNTSTYLFENTNVKWRYFQQTFIRFELEHQKQKNLGCSYFSNFNLFVDLAQYGLKQSLIDRFLFIIQKRSERILKLAELFFHEDFQSFSEYKDIFRFLCIGSVILSLIEQIFQQTSMSRDLATRTQLEKVKERIRIHLCSMRQKWQNTQMQTFFEIKSFSLQIRLARSSYQKDQAKKNLVFQFNKGTFKIGEIGAIGTIFVSLRHDLLQKKDASLIKLFEDICDTLIKNKLQLFIYEKNLLELFFMVKNNLGKPNQCIKLITFIISNLESGCLKRWKLTHCHGSMFLRAYNAFFPCLSKDSLILFFQKIKNLRVKSVHIEFLLFYLSRLSEGLMDQKNRKEIYVRMVKSVQKLDSFYFRVTQKQILKEAIELKKYKNDKQYRMLLRKCINIKNREMFIQNCTCMIKKITHKTIKNKLLQKYLLYQ